ncbi:hypothetical protein AHF37_07025 [Paragonimus kellicotti]|nr:hypothetical protein AHF37_07025 [Paragonimus kellicotti]
MFPPVCSSASNQAHLELFAEVVFPKLSYASAFQNIPSVRFIQSVLEPSSFLILSCECNSNGLITAFGSMPSLECDHCISFGAELNRPLKHSCRSPCTIHLKILSLYLDLPTPLSAFDHLYSVSSGLSEEAKHKRNLLACSVNHVPPCFRPRSKTKHASPHGDQSRAGDCACFASVGVSIGCVQVTVNPLTRQLQIAWPNDNSQLKVISCSFERLTSVANLNRRLHIFPQGTSDSSPFGPLAFMAPLLTQNYCSTCYSWPHSKEHPCTVSSPSFYKRMSSPSKCIFAQNPPVVQLVNDPDSWPDNHCFSKSAQVIPTHQHRCQGELESSWPPQNIQRSDQRDFFYPAFFASRPTLMCCFRLTYLAMMQDIRASYLHWALISRPLVSPTRRPQEALELSDAPDNDSMDDVSSATSNVSSETDGIGLAMSPSSADYTQSPEDLLAHRLSGQSHTSFDLCSWEELVEPDWNVDANASVLSGFSERIIAHLEEGVFDVPSELLGDISSRPYRLALFIPPDQPNLLLVYRYLTQPTVPFAFQLVDMIDLLTGDRLLLSGKSLHAQSIFPSPTLLKRLVATCPQNTTCDGPRNRLIHELNNLQMTLRAESIKLLVDPQGGYSVHW